MAAKSTGIKVVGESTRGDALQPVKKGFKSGKGAYTTKFGKNASKKNC